MKRLLLLLVTMLAVGVQAALAQRTVTGKVVDETGYGFPNANVTVKGTQVGAVSDVEGNFTIQVPEGSTQLTVSGVGYNSQDVNIPAGNIVSVRLAPEARELQGAVVTALAIRREKREIGYSATTINNEELNSGNNVSALSAIQGKTAGANITSTTGGPGGSTRVVLRGEKSISGTNNALIVVDGVIITNRNRLAGVSNLEQIDFGNQGNDVNPDDIESITVLKGPAAAALYGQDAAAGAIMITTKSGKNRAGNKRTEITFSSTYTLSSVLKLPTLQNQYGQGNIYVGAYPDDRRENFSWGAPFDGQLRPWGQVINGQSRVKPYSAIEDNIRDFYRTAQTTENYLSLSGGDDKSSYFISLNALNNTGIIPNTFYNRYGVRFNGSTQLSNKWYSNINVGYNSLYSRVEATGQATGSVTDNLYQTPRDIPVSELKDLNNIYNAYGVIDSTGVQRYGYYGAYTNNPYWIAANYDNRSKSDHIIGQTTVGVRPNRHWDIFNRVSIDYVSDRYTQKQPKYNYVAFDDFWADNPKVSNGGYTEINNNSLLFNNDVIANYNYQFSEKLGLDGLVGNNIRVSNFNSLSGVIDPSSNGLVIPGYYNLTNNQGPVPASNTTTQLRQIGFYGSLRLNYARRLFLEMTGRNDWSSTLAIGNRSFFYPSVNASWVFTEGWENGFTRNVLNYGKLRAGYASVGSGATPYYNNNPGFVQGGVTSGFGSTISPFDGRTPFTLQNQLGNPALRPERTNSYEAGLELGLLHDRITVEATYYISHSVDQIIAVPVSPTSGFTSQSINTGDIENRGIELAVRATPIKTATGFRWELFGTYTRNRNEVLSLSNGLSQIVVGGYSGLSIAAAVGKPFGAMYAIDLLRDPQGRVIVDTTTGIPLRTNTTVYKGSFQPKFIASWGTTFRFKGLSLNVLFDTKQGGKFYSHTKRNLDFNGTALETAANNRQSTLWPNSVYDAGNGNYVQNTSYEYLPYDFYTNDAQTFSGIHVIDASYVKLREASLNWSLPTKLFKDKYISGITVGVFGNNLFLWTAADNKFVDPEMNSGGATNVQGFDYQARPSLRNYGASLRVTF